MHFYCDYVHIANDLFSYHIIEIVSNYSLPMFNFSLILDILRKTSSDIVNSKNGPDVQVIVNKSSVIRFCPIVDELAEKGS